MLGFRKDRLLRYSEDFLSNRFKPSNLTPLSATIKEIGSSSLKRKSCRQFTITQIRSATQDFNKKFVIGRGGFGDVYKGTIEDGTAVALKRWKSASSQGAPQFLAEVDLLPTLIHPNIVWLIGYCNDGKEMILIYEYMSNGSLGDHLHKHRTPLSWSQRLKICLDVAHALQYLHNETSGVAVIYNNVKSADILLDNQWAAKIADFGLCKIIPEDNPSTHVSTEITGTVGYIDPEFYLTGRLSKKSDVYSFGVVLLEVLCRRRPMGRNFDGEEQGLVRWAQDCMRTGKLEQIIDPDLKGQISIKCLNDYVRIVKCCLRERQEQRVTIDEVVFGLEAILALHERTDNSIPQIGITTSDWRLQKHFFSFEQNSDYGDMPEKDFDVIFKTSHQMSPKKSIRFSGEDTVSDEASEPDHEVIDQELSSVEETMKSLYELIQLEYIQRADGLMRMIDFLHLIWFYSVKKEAKVNFRSLLDKFSLFNEYIRKLQDSSRDEGYLMENIQTLLQDIEEDLDDAAFDMVAYLPVVENRSVSVGFENVATGANSRKVPLASFWLGIPEVHASAMSSATQRAISCINDLKVKKLGTAGSGAVEIARNLKYMPTLRTAFDMVLSVHVKHHSIEELMNDIEKEIHRWTKRSSETGNKIIFFSQLTNCLLFVDCSDVYIDLHNPRFDLSKWFETVQIVITSGSENGYCPVDIEIRVEDHLLPWILFSMNVDLETVGMYPSIQEMAIRLIEKCHGHLLAIILLARSLRGVVDFSAWELALQELTSQEDFSTSDVMVRVLRFIWSRMETLSQRCILQCASHYIGSKFKKSSLINSWMKDGLVNGDQEGEVVFEDVIRFFLIEQVGENCVRMRNEIQVILATYFVPPGFDLYPKKDDSEPKKIPNTEESDAWEIHLSNNIISELPDNPNCPTLVNLFLQFNQDLINIPITFFDNMPCLEALDLSGTSIKCLPSSISKLIALRKLFIRDCDLLMELPPEIGSLKNLKVFDSEGTQLICLPEQFGLLTKLECLKFSLYNLADKHKRSNQINHAAVLSKLTRLKELSICVEFYGEWWEYEVKRILDILPKARNLESLRLYFPTIKLLDLFMKTASWRGVPIYEHLSNFGFVVGHLQERLLSRVPVDLHKTFVKMPKCLTYTNGEGDIEVIVMALKNVNALFLDRHWTIHSLSNFSLTVMEKLKFCLLSECNEMAFIVDGEYLGYFWLSSVLESLEYLSVHYMRSLRCIWNGPIHNRCLSNLKTLAMHSCPNLRTIFTLALLPRLNCLEYLIVEDCTMIDSLVSLEYYHATTSNPCLLSLKKISLLHLPEFVSIARGISIAPRLESLTVFDCPSLEELPYMEASDHIKEIKGENEWWDALKWREPDWTVGQPDYLANIFIPLGTDGDIMDELVDAVNLLPHLSN